MGHYQLLTPVVTDSATSNGFVNDNIRQQKSRAIDMRFYWVCNRVRQEHYLVYWERGKVNLANYFTKHHPTKHHRAIRGTYLVPIANYSKHACYQVPSYLRGCVNYPPSLGNGRRMDKVSSPQERIKYGRRHTGHKIQTAINR